ncbi:MAG: hypothetical protein K9H64_23705 [Bacteroidales bacterium]|nr:hypothetical protein [Bacteroidales bacterium]MCF8459063.1 hypothetical protein [Bacteroidales bacterium]
MKSNQLIIDPFDNEPAEGFKLHEEGVVFHADKSFPECCNIHSDLYASVLKDLKSFMQYPDNRKLIETFLLEKYDFDILAKKIVTDIFYVEYAISE